MDNDLRYFNTKRNDYLLMAKVDTIQDTLNDFRDDVIREAKKNLSSQNTSGNLSRSLKSKVKESKRSIQITFEMDYYGIFQDQGVKGIDSGKSLSGYRYTQRGGEGSLKGMPPPKAFDKWNIQKGIAPRDKKGKFLKRKSLNFLIARGIFKKGIKPTLFFTKPFEKYFKRLPEELIEKYGLKFEEILSTMISENFKRFKK